MAAVDGSTATPWRAATPQATLTVRLSQATKIAGATVNHAGASSLGYSVETSTDGTSWRVVATSPSSSTGIDQFKFTPTQAQFVRLDFPGGSGASAPEIDELSVSAKMSSDSSP